MDWKFLTLALALVTFFALSTVDAAIGECPSQYDYAFDNGNYCCHYPEEDNVKLLFYGYPQLLADTRPPCDGGSLRLNSKCCKGGVWVACPHGKCNCRSTVREVCYDFIEEGEADYVGVGVPSAQFRAWCRDQAEGQARILREKFVRIEGGQDGYWKVTDGCDYAEKTNVWGCSQLLASAASDNKHTTPTAAVTRAIVSPPKDSQCNPPRKYVRIRGKLRCRRPKRL